MKTHLSMMKIHFFTLYKEKWLPNRCHRAPFSREFLLSFSLHFHSTPLMHRCVPTGKKAPGEIVRNAYDVLNSWSVAQQLFSDLYTTWPIVLLMCVAAFGMSPIHLCPIPSIANNATTNNHTFLSCVCARARVYVPVPFQFYRFW